MFTNKVRRYICLHQVIKINIYCNSSEQLQSVTKSVLQCQTGITVIWASADTFCDYCATLNILRTMKVHCGVISVILALLFMEVVFSQGIKCNFDYFLRVLINSNKPIWFFTGDPKQHCCPKNERYICGGSACLDSCKHYGCPCTIQTFAPVNGCYCIENYARDCFGVCRYLCDEKCINEMEKCPKISEGKPT